MFSYDDTLADQFHGTLIERAVADTLANARSEHRIRAIVARAVHEARNRGASELAADLLSTAAAAETLGISVALVKRIAAEHHGQLTQVGAKLGPRDNDPWVFRSSDMAAIRALLAGRRPAGRPRKPPASA